MNATLRGPLGLISLDQNVLSIGRSRQNRLVLAHPQVSSKHAEIQPLGEGRFQLVDVGSKNGTSVNGLRLTAGTPYPLSDGDKLLLGGPGGLELLFAWSAAPAQAAPPLPNPLTTTDQEPKEPTRPSGRHAPVRVATPAAVPAPPPLAPGAWPPPQPAGPPAPPLPAQAPGVPLYPAGQPVAPAPTPLPAAVSTIKRARRPPMIVLIGGALLVLVLIVAGIGLGGKVLGHAAPAAAASTPANTSAPTPTAAPAVIQTANITLQGKATTVLTTAQGRTLYYFTPDTATKTACTGSCIASWPPLLFQGSGTPTASPALPGTLSVVTSANGPQVAYQAHQLYTFKGDTAPGQANGQGKGGKWFVATPNLTENGSTPPLIQTANVSIGGKSTTILTTAAGLTLYYFTPDTATTSACTGGCATTWPPLLFSGSGTPTASPALPGTLSVQQDANGAQVEYNGHFLYTFAGDTAPGQTNGQGKGGKWFVATPTLAVQK